MSVKSIPHVISTLFKIIISYIYTYKKIRIIKMVNGLLESINIRQSGKGQ